MIARIMKSSKDVFTCDTCHYIFEAEIPCTQCPDCGKAEVRPANETERQEFEERKKDMERWK